MEKIARDAEAWAAESGLAGPFVSHVSVKDFGFVVEISGSNGNASCTFQRDGRRSMYERTQKFGEEGRR
ncbi:MAG: hypothetical protein ACRD1Z_21030 [Vicinamibacteria bacterium]